MSLVECGNNMLLRYGIKSAVCVALISIAGCSEPVNMGVPEKTAKNTVNEKISFKTFSTGQVASKELESARDNPSSWSYFGEMRRVKVVTLADKTVVDFGFGLNSSFEASQLKDEMASRFKSKGSPDFSFDCSSDSGVVEFSDQRIQVRTENCYAFDGKQTLLISRKYPKYKEPVAEQIPILRYMIDNGSVILFDQNLRVAKATQERDKINKRIAESQKNVKDDM